MKKHISELLNHSVNGHAHFEFVDINVLNDQALFIDPCLIEIQRGAWYDNATILLDNFFNKFYEAYRNNDKQTKLELLSFAREINYTKLGYGNGDNGHGNTAEGLLVTFKNLERLTLNIPSVTKAMDLTVTISGFNEDGLSDMITNILHFQLNEFTLEQLAINNIKPNSEDTFITWDITSSTWKEVTSPCYRYENNKILLTPKSIVRKKYLFGAEQFLKRIILERAKKETAYTDTKGKTRYQTTKKELNRAIPKEDRNWRYKYTNEQTENDQSFLKDYHDAIPYLYDNKGMTDAELDKFIYSA
ncbi:hypothetical protein [Paenibacillus koleovorans]|uniref:hypothetical protein n=1 Tax=Paenibacillus koleovorans TaxID=121608 RepID=UPI000FD7C90C|nr:hypothetical protein [Paenibacillus koleovorans]